MVGEVSRILVCKVLRAKSESTGVGVDVEDFKNMLQLSFKMAHITDTNSVVLEEFNANNIPDRPGRKSSKGKDVRICARFFPDLSGAGFQEKTSEMIRDVGDAVIFDLQGSSPTKFCFQLDHLSSSQEWEDGFIILQLVTSYTITKIVVGEVVIQVMKNGVILTPSLSTETHLDNSEERLYYKMTDYSEVMQNSEFQELSKRTDSLSKLFVEMQIGK